MTIRDLRLENTNTAEYDVCVVGSGPAGLAIAKVLSDRAIHVCLLESGGLNFEESAQSLNQGSQQGFSDNLRTARPRQFGGASSVWVGHCATMDPDDFLPEHWSGSKGWPLDYADLTSYYQRAANFLGLDYRLLDPNSYQKDDFLTFDGDRLQTKLFVQRPTRLGKELKDWISQVDSVDLWIHASLSSVQSKGNKIEQIVARDLGGNELKVKARMFVIAAGGLENPRLLLSFANSNTIPIDQHAKKVIGRFFCLHPHFFHGALMLTGTAAEKPLYLPQPVNSSTSRVGVFQLNSEVRRNANLLKVLFRHEEIATPENSRWYDEKRLAVWRDSKRIMLDTMFIQSAMPMSIDNKIELGSKKDKLGIPKIRATISLNAKTYDNYHRSLLKYISELGLNGYGRVKFGTGAFHDYLRGKRTIWGGHHFMCTTRMAASPNDGVIDKDSRVFGTNNLYIAGASTFSSPSAVNPTFTLIALAIRLGDHLSNRL